MSPRFSPFPLAILLALTTASCGGEPPPPPAPRPADPCSGPELSLGEIAGVCRVAEPAGDPPPPQVVSVEIATRSVASGETGMLELFLRNRTDARVALDFPGTLHFDTEIFRGDERVDERWDASAILGGMLGCRPGSDCRTVRVRLPPAGRLIVSLPFTARVTVVRDGESSGSVVETDGGPIPPGDYEARVILPWSDEAEGTTTAARVPRVVRGALTVTPAGR